MYFGWYYWPYDRYIGIGLYFLMCADMRADYLFFLHLAEKKDAGGEY